MPMGGVGTGTIGLGGRGDLRDWELCNRPSKGCVPTGTRGGGMPMHGPFFALAVKPAGKGAATIARCLEGPLPDHTYVSSHGCAPVNSGLPRFAEAQFDAAYPLGQVRLSDPAVPVDVRLQAFNPMEPGDVESSGLPIAVLRYEVTNRTDQALSVAVCGSLPNTLGIDPDRYVNVTDWEPCVRDDTGVVNRLRQAGRATGVFMQAPKADAEAAHTGTLTLATTAGAGVTHRTRWIEKGWSAPMLEFWEDFTGDLRLENPPANKDPRPWASLNVKLRLPAKATRSVRLCSRGISPTATPGARRTWATLTPRGLRMRGMW